MIYKNVFLEVIICWSIWWVWSHQEVFFNLYKNLKKIYFIVKQCKIWKMLNMKCFHPHLYLEVFNINITLNVIVMLIPIYFIVICWGFLHLRLERFLLITLTFTTTQTLTYNTKKTLKNIQNQMFFFSNTQSDVFLQHLHLNLHSQTKLYCQFWYFWCSCPSNENFKDTLPIFIVKIYLTT